MVKDGKFLEIVKDTKTTLIIASRPLDFDSLGSGLILKKYLEFLGKQVALMWPGKFSKEDRDFNGFLPYFEEIIDKDTREVLSKKNFDVLVVVDGGGITQFYDESDRDNSPNFAFYDKIIRVDHHLEGSLELKAETFYDPTASSTTEVILEKIIPGDFIDENIATLAYAAIAGDTGNFLWNFSPKTFTYAALLQSKGARVLEIIDKLAFSSSKLRLQMLALVIDNVEFFDDLKTMFAFFQYEKIQKEKLFGERIKELKLAFNSDISKRVRGYTRGIMLYEIEPGIIKITARGNNFRNEINLPQVFKELGANGGGHFNACGADIQGDFEEIKKSLIGLIGKHLKEESEIVPATTEQSRSAASTGQY